MCAEIREELKRCPQCQVFAYKEDKVHIGQMPLPAYPHQIVHMDLVGPLQRSKNGNRYLFTLIDALTGWCHMFLL